MRARFSHTCASIVHVLRELHVDDLACRRRKILGEERKANELNDVSTNTGTLNGEPSNPTPKSERCPGMLAAAPRGCETATRPPRPSTDGAP